MAGVVGFEPTVNDTKKLRPKLLEYAPNRQSSVNKLF